MLKRVPYQSTPVANVVRLVVAVNLCLLGGLMFATSAAAADPVRIVAFGDSLTAGYMLKPRDAFPAQLSRALKAKGIDVEISNAGVSGDTTADGLTRIDWSVPDGTEAVILELGANDALRGVSPKKVRKNLDLLIGKLRAKNIDVLLAGMASPENWGPDYTNAFKTIYGDLAEKHDLILYPFFLKGVALRPELNLADGLHPSSKGVAVIVEHILPSVEDLISRVQDRRAKAAKL